jgi:hypothetical protein
MSFTRVGHVYSNIQADLMRNPHTRKFYAMFFNGSGHMVSINGRATTEGFDTRDEAVKAAHEAIQRVLDGEARVS